MKTEEGTNYPLYANVVNNLQESRASWREMYYDLFGMVRNTIRTTNSAKQRLNEIEAVINRSLESSRTLAKKEADPDVNLTP